MGATGCPEFRPLAWSSPDGLTWTVARVSTDAGDLQAVATDGSRLVALGWSEASRVTWTSTDGETWAMSPLADPETPELRAVVAVANGFVAVGDAIVGSPDGVAWTGLISNLNATGLRSVAASPLGLLAIGDSGVWAGPAGVAP